MGKEISLLEFRLDIGETTNSNKLFIFMYSNILVASSQFRFISQLLFALERPPEKYLRIYHTDQQYFLGLPCIRVVAERVKTPVLENNGRVE